MENIVDDTRFKFNFNETQIVTNPIPSESLKVGNNEIRVELVHKYKYLSHGIQISRDNQTIKI